MPPGVEAWSPNHWTTREVPGLFFFSSNACCARLNDSPTTSMPPSTEPCVCDLTGHKGRPGCDSVKDLAVGILAYPAGTSVILGSL